MIPLRDIIQSRTTPFITITIITVNVLAWIFELGLPREELENFLRVYGIVPATFHASTVMTSMFLHGGWMHVIGNMWSLWIFGDNVEDRLGHARFLVFYLLCGIVAGLGQVAVEPLARIPIIGASGAIAGVMGAYIVLFPRSRVLTLVPLLIFWDIIELPAILVLGFWFLSQLINAGAIATTASVGGGVAFAAHVAGFVAGVVAVFVFRRPERPAEWWG